MKYHLNKKILRGLIMGMGITILSFSQAQAKKYYATLITDGGLLHDHSINQSIYDGLLMTKTQYELNINYLQSDRPEDYILNLSTAAEDDADMIFGIGSKIANDIVKSAKMHPRNHFVILGVDTSVVNLPNLTGINYAVEQAGYLAGILAGNMTYKYYKNTNKLNNQKIVGAILGKKNPSFEPYVAGYIAGVRSVDPTISILLSTINTLTDQKKAEKSADTMIAQGADIILADAGNASLGIIKSAQKHNTIVIGTDTDQSIHAPSTVITSVERNIKNSVYNIIRKDIEGQELSNYYRTGFTDNGVRLSTFHKFTNIVPKIVKTQMYKAKREIMQNHITIPTTIDQAFK